MVNDHAGGGPGDRSRPAGPRHARTPSHDHQHDAAAQRLLVVLFLAPTVVGLFLFTLVPIVASVLLAFFRWDIISRPSSSAWTTSSTSAPTPRFVSRSSTRSASSSLAVALQLAIALGLAVLVQSRMPTWLRRVLPVRALLPADPVRRVRLAGHGVPVQPGLRPCQPGTQHRRHSRRAVADLGVRRRESVVILVYVWQNFGFSFLLFVGGLASIPRRSTRRPPSTGPAAGASSGTSRCRCCSPTLLVASVMAIIAALQIFDQPYVLTRGGPGDSTRTAVMVIFESAFQQLQFGRASAIGIVLT